MDSPLKKMSAPHQCSANFESVTCKKPDFSKKSGFSVSGLVLF